MILIDVFACEGTLPAQRRREVAERLLADLTYHDGAPPATLEATRALFHVMVHEPPVWVSGGGPVAPPRYFVRVTSPGRSMASDEVRAHSISTITRVLAEATDGDPQRFSQEPIVSVHIVDVPEGAYGTLGRPLREADFVRLVMGDDPAAGPAGPVEPGAATAVDPICGMTVDLSDDAITLEHGGAVYAFCMVGCRDVFAERLAGSPG